MPRLPLTLTWPAAFWIACALFALTVLVALVRRPAAPMATQVLIALGLALLSLASGGLVWRPPAPREVAVVVDLSPSTRPAEYRRRAALEARVRQLLGGVAFRFWYFSDGLAPSDVPPPGGATLPDLPAERTRYEPPAGATAVLLFSDGRFDLPAGGPPTYPVIDIGLEDPPDAAVVSLESRGKSAAVSVRNVGGDRPLSVAGLRGPSPTTAPVGAFVLTRAIEPGATTISARFAPGDPWPENDGLAAPAPPPEAVERWVVSGAAAATPAGWRVMPPDALPTDAVAYLAPAAIVLDNVPADRLSPEQQDRLRQYVRDLGGGLILLGGDHAFAAGGYPGIPIESISPLASTPPRPTTHWMLLADGSGSMGSAAAGPAGPGPGSSAGSLWHFATEAIVKVLPRLPPEDLVSVGSFAETVTWWSAGRSARDTAALPLPPPGALPHGPTNLRPALETVTRQAEAVMPKELLLLTDADADVGDPAPLAEAMKAKHVRLFLLALGQGRGLSALQRIVDATGGRALRQEEAGKWAAAVQELMRSAEPKLLETGPLAVRFTGDSSSLPGRDVSPWNRTWLKNGATALAEAHFAGEPLAPAARWNVGEGRVLAVGFGMRPGDIESLAKLVGRAPRDPRFRVAWETGPRLKVTVDAVVPEAATASAAYLNGRKLTLDLSPAGGAAPGPIGAAGSAGSVGSAGSYPVPQTGPGRYELSMPAPRSSVLATVRLGHDSDASTRVLERFAAAGRYAPEFDSVGNDFGALRELAERTGGAVIPPQQATPIEFRWPSRNVPLVSSLAAAAALLIALGLVWWRAR